MKMLFTLMESKKSQGVLNVDFGFENLLDMISPKKVMDDIRQVRKEIRYNYAKYAELEDGDPAKLDVGDKLNELFEEASNNYNNVMAMLPLAIEDIKTRLLLGAGGQQGGGNQIALGMLTMGDKGELKVLEAPKQESTALATLDDNVNTGLIAALQEDYQAINESPQTMFSPWWSGLSAHCPPRPSPKSTCPPRLPTTTPISSSTRTQRMRSSRWSSPWWRSCWG